MRAFQRCRVGQLLGLLRLTPQALTKLETMGDVCPLDEKAVWALLRVPADEQLDALNTELARRSNRPTRKRLDEPDPTSYEALGPLRMVAYFNPQLFVDTRRRTEGHCVSLQQRVEGLNKQLAHCKRSRKRDSTHRKFSRELERLSYLGVFDIELEAYEVTSPSGASMQTFRGALIRKERTWTKRRRYDGFVLLVAHPDVAHTATELTTAYHGKDVVEKGFQTIKSVTELRPILHHRHPKVLAHVALCMLALLVVRTLRRRLRQAGSTLAASSCLGLLKTCHLNLRTADKDPSYDLTRPNHTQQALLRLLNFDHHAEEDQLRARIRPRPI